MPILSKDELQVAATVLMGGVDSTLSPEAKGAAVDQALSELGWAFPLADGQISYWAIERTKRHMYFVLMSAAAYKFQYKHIHLEHRFKHLKQLISDLDSAFLDFVEDNPDLFDSIASTYDDFSWYIQSGFTYDVTGIEVEV